jgi:hydroxymethylpyrimidine/phosphomethylpyrimidine kinase
MLSAPFVRGVSTHGTGCTYSAALAGYLARGRSLSQAVQQAKEYITQAIARSQTAAGYSVLNSFRRAN